MRTFQNPAALAATAGQEVGVSDWVEVTQTMVNQFAEATGDHQWIHVDVERAKAGPFGAPIAHGFLTLSLLPRLMAVTMEVTDKRMSVNYGLNKVRFTSPAPVGCRLRGRVALAGAEDIGQGGWQFTWKVTIEREGADKPICVAETLSRMYG